MELHLGSAAIGGGHPQSQLLQPLLCVAVGSGGVGPDAAGHGEHIGDKVVRGACVDGQHRAHQTFQRVGVAADHRLKGVDHRSPGHDHIGTLMRGPAVAGNAVERDDKVAFARHHRTFHHGNLPGGQLGPVVQTEKTVWLGGQFVPQTVVQHGLGPLGDLLGGLEEKDHVACQLLFALGQQSGRAIEPHGMEVVAAAVHEPVALGYRPVVGGLLLGNGVNVGPEGHRSPGTVSP